MSQSNECESVDLSQGRGGQDWCREHNQLAARCPSGHCDCCGREAAHLNFDQAGESAICDMCLWVLTHDAN